MNGKSAYWLKSGSIPYYSGGDFIDELAYALWWDARYAGELPLDEAGSWKSHCDWFLEKATRVAGILDNRPRRAS